MLANLDARSVASLPGPSVPISIAEPLRNGSDRGEIDASMPDPTHLDDVTGALARVIQVLRPPARNTLDRLGVYEGRTLERSSPLRGALRR